jgi:hypothetical protein
LDLLPPFQLDVSVVLSEGDFIYFSMS